MALASPPVREIMSWMDLGDGARAIAEQVHSSGWHPDIVLAIARGGLLVGGAVGYALGVKNTCTMNVEFYTDVDERLDVPMVLPPIPDLVDLGARACRSSTTSPTRPHAAGRQGVLRRQGRRHARRAVLYEKPRSVVKCEYVWRRTDRWVVFPWSAQPPVGGGRGEQGD